MPAGAPGTLESLRNKMESAVDQLREKPAARSAEVAKSTPSAPRASPPPKAALSSFRIPADRTWVYAVTVEPPVWRDITLTYRTENRGPNIGAMIEFRHSTGKSHFYLGTLVAGDPS